MNTDPVKEVGRIQEQIEMEYKSRRNFPRKWSKLCEETPWKEMYNQNEINEKIKMELKDHNISVVSNEKDLNLISPEMHKSLLPVCRCGRPRSGLHLLKCLQNQQNKYPINATDGINDTNKLPGKSSGFVGWQSKQPRYKQWEDSMKYISPIYDVPGKKITATSYDTIIIG